MRCRSPGVVLSHAARAIERSEIRHLAAKPEDSVLEKLYIREGVEGCDKHSAQYGKEQKKKKRKGEVVRPLKGYCRCRSSKRRNKNVKRKHLFPRFPG